MNKIRNYCNANAHMLLLTAAVLVAMTFGIIPHEAAAGLSAFAVLNTSAFPINNELSAVAIAFQNPQAHLIADQVLPRIPGPQKFTYTRYAPEQGYTIPDTRVGRKSEPNMVDFGGTQITLETEDYGLDDLVPNSEVAAFEAMPKPSTGGPVDPMSLSTMMLTNLVLLDREVRVANLVFNAATYAAGNQATLSGTSQWSDFVNANPVDAILAALDIPLVRPNVLVIGQLAVTKFRQHPRIVQAIGNSAQTSGNASLEQIAELLDLEKIIVGRAFYNTAKKGQPPVMARAWGKHAALIHVDKLSAQLEQPTFGMTAQFGDRIAGVIPSPTTGLRGGSRVRSGESVKEVIISQEAGYYFQNVVA